MLPDLHTNFTRGRSGGLVFPSLSEAEVERFYEDLQDLLELTPKKDVLFIIGDWNAKVESQQTPGVTGKFGLGVQNEAGQRLTEFCQETALVIANTLLQQHKRRLYTWTSPDSQQSPPLHFRKILSNTQTIIKILQTAFKMSFVW